MNTTARTKKIVLAALMAALTCLATMIIKIPSPLKGYLNLGDGIVLTAAWILSPTYGFLAAALGSALADLFSGYVIYAPATFIIKGLMVPIAYFMFQALQKKCGKLLCKIISGTTAEIFMVLGYFVFEGFLYGFIPSAVNILPNAAQGVAGLIVGIILSKAIEKTKLSCQ